MSSVLRLERSQTATTDVYDHAINLIDSSHKLSQDEVADSGETGSESGIDAVEGDSTQLSRQWTRPHLRKEIARRKYAKYQEEAEEDTRRDSLQSNGENIEDNDNSGKPAKQGTWGTQGRLRDKVPFRSSKKRQSKAKPHDTTFIDVLYENQRGSFLCGIPLYSANSLLNFDPSSWQTATFKDSPVDISNAQVPDPSWAWEWRSWYVDMSHDVDEEGWEYSFSFSPNFAWHGSHPWFHSFCRRRRWLRKRVKVSAQSGMRDNKNGKDFHRLAADYFTIHPLKGRSRSTSGDRSATRRSSTLAGYQTADDDDEEPLGEISNVTLLMTAIKRARVDREKFTAVTQFLAQGGDELFYLADNIPAIMDDFIYQTSRRQLQSTLLKALDETLSTSPSDSSKEEASSHHRRIHNLLNAITAAGIDTDDQEYWDALRAKAKGEDVEPTVAEQSTALDGTSKAEAEKGENIKAHIEEEDGLGDEMKGISKDAEISVEPGIRRPNTENEEDFEDGEGKVLDKGKGKEKETAE